LGDGSTAQATHEVQGLVVGLEYLLILINALILDAVGYDLLLGRDFLKQTSMWAEFGQNSFTLSWLGMTRTFRSDTGYKVWFEAEI
jgi:hypothetical protein